MKFFCVIITCLFLAGAASAQEPCNIGLNISPDIRGLQLGMSLADVKAKFPNSIGFIGKDKPDEVGQIDDIELSGIDIFGRDEFKGIVGFVMTFTDGKLSGLGVIYSRDTQWRDIDEFTPQVSKALAMPFRWREPTNADPKSARVMDCKGFRVVARIGAGQPSFVGLVDTTAEQLVKDRRAAIEEKKRRAFKP